MRGLGWCYHHETGSNMFTGITTELCATAWGIVLPAVEAAAAQEVSNARRGAIVVIDPTNAAGEVLFSAYVGEANPQLLEWATAKAAVTLRTGLNSSRVGQDYPHLYRDGDIKWPGAVLMHGLVVAFSGVQGEFDEMIAEWVASAIRGLSRDAMYRPDGAMHSGGPYLGS